MALEDIIRTSSTATAKSAETHRLSAISNIENALHHGTFPKAQEKRLRRLLRILKDSARDGPDRKLAVLQYNIVPALQSINND